MKIFCTMLLALVVAISLNRCKAKFLLVKADEAPEKDESRKDELENLPTELDPISYLFNKIKKLEEKDVETKKLIDEKDYEIKKMIEERDETAKSQASQVEDLSARFENFEGKAHMELVFTATAFLNKTFPQGKIEFDNKVIDPLNSFNDAEGLFQVPSSGNYLFFFNSAVQANFTSTPYSMIYVYVNGNIKYKFTENIAKPVAASDPFAGYQHNFMFTSKLWEYDELYLKNQYPDTLYSDADRPMTFIGYKTN